MAKILILFVLALTIISCSVSSDNVNDAPVALDQAYTNQQVRLIAVKEMSPFKTKYGVSLALEYNSENKIVFPPNYNLRIFIWENNNWLEIEEKSTIRPKDDVVLSPDNPVSYAEMVTFFPQLPDLKRGYRMRAYIFGDMTTEEGIKQVAAFANFVLTP